MSKKRRLFKFALEGRRTPSENRKKVGMGLSLVSVFLFFVFLINFAIIIITDTKFGKDLSEGARSVHQKTVTVQAKRGAIFDRNGEAIAEDSTTYSIYAVLNKDYVSAKGKKLYIQENQYDTVAGILSEKLGLDPNYVKEQLRTKDVYQVSFGLQGNNISYSLKTEIEAAMDAAGIKGIGFSTSPGRLYANGVFASHFIGFTQLEDNKDGTQSLVGKNGIEASLNDILSGTDGIITYEKDYSGNTKPGTEKVTRKPVDGKDVYTTISAPIQSYLETTMNAFQEKANGLMASATLVAADTGEIIATTQRPTFDADTKEGMDTLNWESALYQKSYEPGSTMKVMTLASAIDNGSFNPDEVYNNEKMTIADRTIYDWGVNQGLTEGGYLTFAQGFAYSSNIGMAKLEKTMGDRTWLNYLSRFNFGYPTRFGMDYENFGTVNSDNEVTTAMSAFGQGISVTQIQMLKAFSTVANEGEMLTPRYISALYDPNTETARKADKEIAGKPVSADAANQTLRYMVTVGTDSAYGTLYNKSTGTSLITVNGEPAAVKSGTAQIPKAEGGGYMEGDLDNIYSVVAMTPSENPDFIMYIMVQQPEHWASTYWTEVINPVLEEATRMKDALNLTSPTAAVDQVPEEMAYQLPDVVGKKPGDMSTELRKNLVQPVVIGSANDIKEASVKVGSNLSANQRVLLWTGDLKKIPDMYAWSKENAEQFAKWSGIKITFKGDGSRIVSQSVDAGLSAEEVKKITVTLGE